MPCLNRSFGCSERGQTAAISRSSRRHCPSTNVLVSDLVALPAGDLPPGILWSSGSQHHKHFRNCSYHRKHKPLCHHPSIGSLHHSLHPLDDQRSQNESELFRVDGRQNRLASLWSRRPSIVARNSPFPIRVPTTIKNLKGRRCRLSSKKTTSNNPFTTQSRVNDSTTSPCDFLNLTCDNVIIAVDFSDDNDPLSHLLSRSSQSLSYCDDNNNQINQFLLESFVTQLLS